MTFATGIVQAVLKMSDACNALQFPHAFGGAIANNYWGIIRATQDVDLLVSAPSIRYQDFATELEQRGFRARSPDGVAISPDVGTMTESVRSRHLFEVYFSGIRVEVFMPFIPLQNSLLARRVVLPFADATIAVTTAEDIILLKMIFHREKDIRDVRGIIWNQKGKLDMDYIRRWSCQILPEDVLVELDRMLNERI